MMDLEGNAGCKESGDDSSAVYTAIPFDKESASKSEVAKYNETPADPTDETPTDPADELRPYNYYCTGIGFVIGCFIQLSCIGSFLFYAALITLKNPGTDSKDTLRLLGRTQNQIIFSLVWSAFISALALALMVLLSTLFQQVQKVLGGNVAESFIWHMEYYVATGAVLGVSLAWTAKNVLFGSDAEPLQLVVMLGVAVIYRYFSKYLLFRSEGSTEEEEQKDEEAALLGTSDQETVESNSAYKVSSVFLGLVVGCFIQLSSLGANYMLMHLWSQHKIPNGDQSNQFLKYALGVNLVWDIVTSGLGVLVLVLVRRLLLLQWPHTETKDASELWSKVLLNVESYYAIGALIGVNLSWVVTNYLLQFQSNMYHSLVMLLVSLVWCFVVAYSTEHGETNEDDDAE